MGCLQILIQHAAASVGMALKRRALIKRIPRQDINADKATGASR